MIRSATPPVLKSGDHVTFLTSGPIMTVASVDPKSGKIYCVWCDETGQKRFRGFYPDTLHPADVTNK